MPNKSFKEKVKSKVAEFLNTLDISSDEDEPRAPTPRRPTASSPTPRTLTPSTAAPNTSTSGRPTLTHDECKNLFRKGAPFSVSSHLRAAFGPYDASATTSTSRPPAKKAKIVAAPCTLGSQVVLIPFAANLGAPNKNDISVLSRLQMVKNSVTASNQYSADALKAFFQKEFKNHLSGIDFEILMKDGPDLIVPQLQEGSFLTSKKVSQIFYQKKVFLRPFRDILIDQAALSAIMVSFKANQRFVIFSQYQIAEIDGLLINDEESLLVSVSPNHTVISLPDYSTNSESPNPPPDFLDTGVDDSDIVYLPNQADWREVSETPPSGDAENLPPVLSQDPPLEEPLESPAAFVELKDVTYKNIIQQLGSQLTHTKQTPLYISRSRVFRSAGTGLTNSSFNPKGDIFVKFMDEWGLDERGVDTGGLRNEFFRLALKEISMSPMFEGEHMSRNLALDADSLRLNDYKTAGIIMSLAIVHNGPVPQFFSPELFEMLVSGEYSREVAISKIMDADIRTEIETLSAAKDLRELENAVVNSMLLTIQGVTSVDSFRRKQAIIDNLLDYCLNIRLQPAFNQLCEGLKTLHVLEFVRKYPTKMRTAFVKPEAKLTAGVVKKMLEFKFSDDEREIIKEESMLCHLLYYLDNLEGGKLVNVTLEDFLILLTAYPSVPPGGFQKKLTIKFDHSTAEGLRPYPWASSCDLQLTLPIYTCQYADFEERMSEALQTKNFGRA